MACVYGNCNDANCASGADSDVNGNPCDDASCAPCGSVMPGAAGSTVTPNPSIPNTAQGSSASALSQLSSTMGQWGATIAGIVTNTPTVVAAKGATTGISGVPGVGVMSGSSGILLLLIVSVVVVLLVMDKK